MLDPRRRLSRLSRLAADAFAIRYLFGSSSHKAAHNSTDSAIRFAPSPDTGTELSAIFASSQSGLIDVRKEIDRRWLTSAVHGSLRSDQPSDPLDDVALEPRHGIRTERHLLRERPRSDLIVH